MAQNPVIFLTFANQVKVPQKYLPMLLKEKDMIQRYLNRLDRKGAAKVKNLGQISIEHLYHQIIDYDDQKHKLAILHYGGHADHHLLELIDIKGNAKAADATGIARLLGTQQDLLLVFLNGCATLKQVDALLENGVKAIIATSTAVHDKMASEFAIQFYQALSRHHTIAKAFEIASSFLETNYNAKKAIIKPRKVYWSGRLEEPQIDNIYGLYIHKDHKEVLDFKFGEPQTKQESLGRIHRYLCDRHNQNDAFYEKFTEQQGPYFFCAVHGPRRQSHKGLFKRLDFEYLRIHEEDETHAKYITLPEKHSIEEYQKSIRISLFKEFGIRNLPLKEMSIQRLAQEIQHRHLEKVAIHFQIKSTRWKKFTPDLFRWFMNSFCEAGAINDYGICLYFFLNIIYEDIPDSRSAFNKWIGKPHPEKEFRDRINKALTQLNIPQYTCLPELDAVPFTYIEDWMDYIAETDMEKEIWLQKHFPERAEVYDMEEVELRLDQIINEYNQNYLAQQK